MFASGAGVEVVENRNYLATRVYLPMTFAVRNVYDILVLFSNYLFLLFILDF